MKKSILLTLLLSLISISTAFGLTQVDTKEGVESLHEIGGPWAETHWKSSQKSIDLNRKLMKHERLQGTTGCWKVSNIFSNEKYEELGDMLYFPDSRAVIDFSKSGLDLSKKHDFLGSLARLRASTRIPSKTMTIKGKKYDVEFYQVTKKCRKLSVEQYSIIKEMKESDEIDKRKAFNNNGLTPEQRSQYIEADKIGRSLKDKWLGCINNSLKGWNVDRKLGKNQYAISLTSRYTKDFALFNSTTVSFNSTGEIDLIKVDGVSVRVFAKKAGTVKIDFTDGFAKDVDVYVDNPYCTNIAIKIKKAGKIVNKLDAILEKKK